MDSNTCGNRTENVQQQWDEIQEYLHSHGITEAEFKAKLEENTLLLKEIEKAVEECNEIDESTSDLLKLNAEAVNESVKVTNERDHWTQLLLDKQREKEELLRRYVDLSISFEKERIDRATKEIMSHQVDFRRSRQQEDKVKNEKRQKLMDEVASLKDTVSSLEHEIKLKNQSHRMLQEELKKLQNVKVVEAPPSENSTSTRENEDESEWFLDLLKF